MKNYSSHQTPNHSQENALQQKTTLFIRIHAVISDLVTLGEVLTSKVNTEGVELTPTETSITRDDQFTYCSLTCDTDSETKKLKDLLMKNTRRLNPLIDCSFTDLQQGLGGSDQRQPALQRNQAMAKDILKKQVEFEISSLSEDVL